MDSLTVEEVHNYKYYNRKAVVGQYLFYRYLFAGQGCKTGREAEPITPLPAFFVVVTWA